MVALNRVYPQDENMSCPPLSGVQVRPLVSRTWLGDGIRATMPIRFEKPINWRSLGGHS
jgi:hypothetical protein